MNLLLAAADDAPKNMNGGWGLLVFVLLAIVVFFLFRSMNKHLRKVQRMNDEDAKPDAARHDTVPPQQPKS
jgi:uncharacterized membrane protein